MRYPKALYPLLALFFIFRGQAAEIPSGTVLHKTQTLVKGNGAEVAALDPQKVEGLPEGNVLRDLLEGLLISGADGKLEGGVAERWSSPDLKTWTFHLRKSAKWSNGDPVTAEDFVYSWRRLVDPKTASPYGSYLGSAKVKNAQAIVKGCSSPEQLGVQAVDPHTLKITLEEPLSYFTKLLTHHSVLPVHRATVEQHGHLWTQPKNWVGNGAYKLRQWVVNEKLTLVRNEAYWNNAKTIINQVTYLPIASEITELFRYRAGEIDITSGVPIDQVKRLRQTHGSELRETPILSTYYFSFNNSRPPFNDKRVRKALLIALDRQLIVQQVRKQNDIPAYGFTPPYTDGMPTYGPEWAEWSMEKRIEHAKALLAAAGYTKSKPLKATLLYNTAEAHKKISLAVAAIWKSNLGVELKLENKEWKTFLDSRRSGNFEITRAGWQADYNEPASFLGCFHSNSSNNPSRYANPEYDQLLARALSVGTAVERANLYRQAEALLAEDATIVPVYHTMHLVLVKPHVGGYPPKNPLREVYTKNLYILQH